MKLWPRKQDGHWCISVTDGNKRKTISFGKEKREAELRMHRFLADKSSALKDRQLVVGLVDEFLIWVKDNLSKNTTVWYTLYLRNFSAYIGNSTKVMNLHGAQVEDWIRAKYGKTTENNQRNACRAVKRLFNWAVERQYITVSPLAGFRNRYRSTPRKNHITPEQFATILEKVKDRRFRDVLIVLWESGCRPLELRQVEARHFNRERKAWIFDRSESKGKHNERVVFLTDNALEITERLIGENPKGPLFRNSKGKPWAKQSLLIRAYRLRKKINFPFTIYSLRHGFATRLLKDKQHPLFVARLMGHSSTAMLEKHYEHATEDDTFMRGILTGEQSPEGEKKIG